MGIAGKSRWSGLRKVASCATAAALALSLTPAAAFAAVDANGNVSYTMPTTPVDIQTVKTDAQGHQYTQENISVMLGTPPMQTTYCRILGISNAGLANDRVEQLKNPATFTDAGLFGSDANVAPDEYFYNYCVSKTNASAVIPEGHMAKEMTTVNRSSYGNAVEVSISGTNYNMPDEVYTEVNLLNGAAANGNPTNAAAQGKTWAEWVALENQRPAADRPKTGTYAPVYDTLPMTSALGTYNLVEVMYSLADLADGIIADSKDANGNYKYATRYAEGPTTSAVAEKFEDISKGIEYVALAKKASGDIKDLATVAVICGYDENTHNFAVRVLDTGVAGDETSNVYGGRLASAVNPMAKDMTAIPGLKTAQETYVGTATKTGMKEGENNRTTDQSNAATYVKWYDADTIIQNADAVFVSDCPAVNATAVPYLAADTKGNVSVAPSADAAIAYLADAQTKAKADGKNVADVCYKYPDCLFGNFYAQGCENVMLNFITASYLYPDYFNLTDTMAWWAKNIWHVTDSSLQDVIDSTCYDISLSKTQPAVGTMSNGFEAKIDAQILEGNKYYLEHMSDVDKIANGNIKTHSPVKLAQRSGYTDAQVTEIATEVVGKAQEAQAAAEAKLATLEKSATATQEELDQAKIDLTAAQKAASDAEAATETAKGEADAAKTAQAAAESEAAAAKTAQEAAEAQLTTYKQTVLVNKATVKAADIEAGSTTVILGAKTKKIAANAFKGKKATTVVIMSTKLKKGKVKNCFKGSSVKAVQVPSSKYAAYKKFMTKKVTGKKVTVA